MTMTQAATAARGASPYQPRAAMATTGNFHRAHEELLDIADKDGVFQSTAAQTELVRRMGTTRPAAASAIFQWSDPTDKIGFRRVRLLTPRTSAAQPNEMAWDEVSPVTEKASEDLKAKAVKPPAPKDWAERAFGNLPQANPKGDLYLQTGKHGAPAPYRSRRHMILSELLKHQAGHSDKNGFFHMRRAVEALADRGVNPHSVYDVMRVAMAVGGAEKFGWRRRLKPEYVETYDMTRAQKAELDKARTPEDPPEDPPAPVPTTVEAFVAKVRDEPTPGGVTSGSLEALLDAALATPEAKAMIDRKINEAVVAGLRRQLGVG